MLLGGKNKCKTDFSVTVIYLMFWQQRSLKKNLMNLFFKIFKFAETEPV